MKKQIKTYKDLAEERERLENLLAIQQQRVLDDWAAVKMELAPVTNAFGVAKKIFRPTKDNPVLNTGLSLLSNLFLRNFVLAKAGILTRLAVPMLLKNYTSHVVADKAANVLGKLERIFKRSRRKRTTESPVPPQQSEP